MQSVLLLFNIQKTGNFGNLIRTANALGVAEICVVGRKKFSTHGHQATKVDTLIRHFFRLGEALSYYRQQGFTAVGVEISQASYNIHRHRFAGDTLFIMGNETSGLSAQTIAECAYCVFIPQFGVGASLNVNVAAGIVLNAFNAGRTEHNPIVAAKFVAPVADQGLCILGEPGLEPISSAPRTAN